MKNEATSDRDARLFVPLASEPFRWFEAGWKEWELRRNRGQYAVERLKIGRAVELRRGYRRTPEALWGSISEVVASHGVAAILDETSFETLIPTATSREDATQRAIDILGPSISKDPLVCFRIKLKESYLRLRDEYLALAESGQKRSTIRLGERDSSRILHLQADRRSLRTIVVDRRLKSFDALTESDANLDGFPSLADLHRALRSIYPDIEHDSKLTIFEFRLSPAHPKESPA